MSDCLFCRIASGDIPAETIYENEQVLLPNINPRKTHLIIPKAPGQFK